MTPARVRDLPVLAWVVGRAFARAPYGRLAPVVAVVGWPFWLLVLGLSIERLWHRDRGVVAVVGGPESGFSTRVAAWVLVGTAAVAFATAYTGHEGLVVAVLMVVAGGGTLTFLTPYGGKLMPGPKRGRTGMVVTVGMAASGTPRSSGALLTIARLVVDLYPGMPVEVVARDRRAARAYRRWGLRQVRPDRGRMVLVD